jgi:hypothetical protein
MDAVVTNEAVYLHPMRTYTITPTTQRNPGPRTPDHGDEFGTAEAVLWSDGTVTMRHRGESQDFPAYLDMLAWLSKSGGQLQVTVTPDQPAPDK